MDLQRANHLVGPSVAWMLVGAHLRRLREARGVSRERAGAVIQASHAKISRIELGRARIRPPDVECLLALYGVPGGMERQMLLTLAGEADGSRWWKPYRDVVPPWFEAYLDLEPFALHIRSYDVDYMPGLLQTADYCRAVMRQGHPHASEYEIQRRVALRMLRQQVFRRPEPPWLWAVIDEAALHKGFGGAATMRAQLRHVIDIASRRAGRITVQVLPSGAAGNSAAAGPLTMLRLPGWELPDVVYRERLTGADYPARPDDIVRYWHLLNAIAVKALSPQDSIDRLREASGGLGA
ncbi:helix-turn-helix domain-containing protein [Actinomadura sp. 6N118]|uniref:helix-turn-helix domain-containing protein n=1 Tax=Actinomadura sp. 6N118 TaxID=3375151 RepID=UPI0037A42D18